MAPTHTLVLDAASPTIADSPGPTHGHVHLLFIEDNPGDARLVEMQLAASGGFSMDRAGTLREALDLLAATTFDLVLLDLSLPDAHGTSTFDAVRVAAPTVPVVVLTGYDDEATALALVHAGAQDYLVKDRFEGPLIARSVRYALERHQLLQAVDAARRRESEQKDRFLSHVSHQLRSPLTVSYLYTTNLLDGIVGDLTREQHEHLAVAVDGLRAQMRLIDELLATVRADPSLIRIEKTDVSLQWLFADVVSAFGVRAGGVTVVDGTDPALPPVHADPTRIRQVLTTLVDNALNASPPGAAVHVRAEPSSDEPGFARVDVTDRGPGIHDDARERVFDRLYREDAAGETPKGLGLGLYLAKLLVSRHGGRIWVEPAPGGGSRFSFTVPFSCPPTPLA